MGETHMTRYNSGLIGKDVKPPRNVSVRKNRDKVKHGRWLVPAFLVIVTVTLIVVAGTIRG